MDAETKQITVVDSEVLIEEAEARTHKPGQPSDLEKRLMGKHKLKVPKGWWPEEKRIEVVALYASGVISPTDLERLTGVPFETIRKWRGEDWWTEMLEKVHTSIDSDNVSKLTQIVDKSLEVIQDRLINGDYILNKKTGEIHRRPVALRDASIVANTVVDKRQLLRGKPTSRAEKVSVDARLLKLAEEFARFAASHTIEHQVADEAIYIEPLVEITDAHKG